MLQKGVKRKVFSFLFLLAACFCFSKTGNAAVYRGSNGTIINGAYAKGIDVSKNNGVVNWKAVKASGVDFAIIRCGYGTNRTDQDDSQWAANVAGCEAAGIPYGVYIYSYADSVSRAKSEAAHVLRLISGHKLAYPVYFDMEDPSIVKKTTKTQRGKIAKAFCDTINAAGYKAAIYADKYTFENELTAKEFNQWGKWVAHYSVKCGYNGTYQMWQATNRGKVAGIRGYVDINYLISNQIFVKPVIKVTKAGKKKIKITWKPKKAGTTCQIYYSKKKNGKYKLIQKNGKKGKCNIKGLKSGKKYYIKVRIKKVVNGVAVYSKYSKIKGIKIK